MFGLFTRNKPVDEMRRAEAAYEKIASLKGDSHDARSLRLRMGLEEKKKKEQRRKKVYSQT